jgi:hypothetical protein
MPHTPNHGDPFYGLDQSQLLTPIFGGTPAVPINQPGEQVFSPAMQTQADAIQNAETAASLQNIGLATSIAGAVSSIFGAVYSAQVGKEQAKGQARMLEHEAFMSNMNARRAERNAGAMMQQGRAAIAQMTAEAGQVKARQRTSAAARGVVIDQGSARDVTDTTEIVKEVQRVAINRQAVSRAGDARVAETNFRNQSLLSNVGAGSLRSAANRIEPLSSGGAQFISATGGFLKDRAAYMRRS